MRYNYTLTSWLLSDLFYQRQENEFIDLDSRNLIGIGPRFRLGALPRTLVTSAQPVCSSVNT